MKAPADPTRGNDLEDALAGAPKAKALPPGARPDLPPPKQETDYAHAVTQGTEPLIGHALVDLNCRCTKCDLFQVWMVSTRFTPQNLANLRCYHCHHELTFASSADLARGIFGTPKEIRR